MYIKFLHRYIPFIEVKHRQARTRVEQMHICMPSIPVYMHTLNWGLEPTSANSSREDPTCVDK